ncbi:MAG: hypothetical protein AAF730_15500 [Bacteroidota bacterium]
MKTSLRPIQDVIHEGRAALVRELGVVDALRFIQQFNAGSGNYTEERDAFLGEESLDEIIAQVRAEDAKHIP